MNQASTTTKAWVTHAVHPHASSPSAKEATRPPAATAGLAEEKHQGPSVPVAGAVPVRRAGAWLADQGVRAGDVVALCAPDSIDVAITRCAASSIGAIVVMLSPSSPRRDLFAQLCVSGARWLVTTSDLFAQKLEVAVRPSAVVQTFLIANDTLTQAI
jgi:long-subunit acyl-CoA synthetase (AMP-forming)